MNVGQSEGNVASGGHGGSRSDPFYSSQFEHSAVAVNADDAEPRHAQSAASDHPAGRADRARGYYDGKYGLSMQVRGLDWSNYNAEPRAIVIHNAWYAEDDMIPIHGKLGRSEGCFAMSRKSQWDVMRKLAGGRMIYADKLA